jgi:hypothetical protein
VQDDASHQLDVEETDAERALERLTNGGICLEEQLLERLAVFEPPLELGRLPGQLLVGQRLELRLDRRDVGGLLGEPLHAAAFTDPKNLFEGAELLSHRET